MHFDPHCWVHCFLTNLIHNPIWNTDFLTESKFQPCVCVNLVGNRVSLIICLCPQHSSGLLNKQGFSTHNSLLSIQRALRGFHVYFIVPLHTQSTETSLSRSAWSIHTSENEFLFCNLRLALSALPLVRPRLIIWFCCTVLHVLSSLNTVQYKTIHTLSIGM